MLDTGDAELAGRGLAGILIHPRVFDHYHRGAAPGQFLVVADEPVCHRPIRIGQARVLRSLYYLVLEPNPTDVTRLEQLGKTGAHGGIPFTSGSGYRSVTTVCA